MASELDILLVDDRDVDRTLTEIVLRAGLSALNGPGFELMVATDAVVLGEWLAARSFHAAVIEADLSWCDAAELVRRLRRKHGDMPVIFYSAKGLHTLTPTLAELGLAAYLTKDAGDLVQIPVILGQRLAPRSAPIADPPLSEPQSQGQSHRSAPSPAAPAQTGGDESFRSEMFYGISHDLRQPLQILCRQIKLLDRNYRESLDPAGRELVENMVRVAAHMEMLLDSILSYYRLDAAEQGAGDRAAIGDVLSLVLEAFQPELEEIAAITVVGPMPDVRVNRSRFAQLFQNLINNAIKFRGADPLVIEIRVLDGNDHWLFTVEDNGIGVEREEVDRIFTLFRRSHSQEKYPGSGVGLALCKRIVEQHGGSIWARSSPGQGLAVCFTLPKHTMTAQGQTGGYRSSRNAASDRDIAGRG